MIRRNSKRRRGAAAVEFALVAPLFIMFLFGILEFGRAMMVQQMLINATREGAREAAIPSSTSQSVKSSVVSFLNGASVPCTSSHVTVNMDAAANNGKVDVSVTIPFADVSWIPGRFITTNLSAATSMRSERFE